jgi:hypothetical protein
MLWFSAPPACVFALSSHGFWLAIGIKFTIVITFTSSLFYNIIIIIVITLVFGCTGFESGPCGWYANALSLEPCRQQSFTVLPKCFRMYFLTKRGLLSIATILLLCVNGDSM